MPAAKLRLTSDKFGWRCQPPLRPRAGDEPDHKRRL